jgi:hypothetical protein
MAVGNGQSRYSVRVSGAVAADLKQLQRRAWHEGRGEAFLDAFRVIVDRLTHAPKEFGEPLYRLPALKLEVRHASRDPLVVYFAVHDEEPLVFVKVVRLLPGP